MNEQTRSIGQWSINLSFTSTGKARYTTFNMIGIPASLASCWRLLGNLLDSARQRMISNNSHAAGTLGGRTRLHPWRPTLA